MTDPQTHKSRLPHWGWLLALGVVLAVAAAFLSVWVPYQRQMAAIKGIEGWGGEVRVGRGGPEWLRRIVGGDSMRVFDPVQSVSLIGAPSEAVRSLNAFGQLFALSIDHAHVLNGTLSDIPQISTIEVLQIRSSVPLTDHLEQLRYVTSAHALALGGKGIDDNALRHIGEMGQCSHLLFYDTAITNEGLEYVAGLRDLIELQFRPTSNMKPQITDGSVHHLSKLKNLRFLDVSGTAMTEEGVKQLEEALPQCHISSGFERKPLPRFPE